MSSWHCQTAHECCLLHQTTQVCLPVRAAEIKIKDAVLPTAGSAANAKDASAAERVGVQTRQFAETASGRLRRTPILYQPTTCGVLALFDCLPLARNAPTAWSSHSRSGVCAKAHGVQVICCHMAGIACTHVVTAAYAAAAMIHPTGEPAGDDCAVEHRGWPQGRSVCRAQR